MASFHLHTNTHTTRMCIRGVCVQWADRPTDRYGLSLDADAINLAGGEAALLGREIHKRHSARLRAGR